LICIYFFNIRCLLIVFLLNKIILFSLYTFLLLKCLFFSNSVDNLLLKLLFLIFLQIYAIAPSLFHIFNKFLLILNSHSQFLQIYTILFTLQINQFLTIYVIHRIQHLNRNILSWFHYYLLLILISFPTIAFIIFNWTESILLPNNFFFIM